MSTAETQRALARLAAHIADYAGLALPDWVLEARVRDRVAALGLASARDYVDRVLSGPRTGADEHDEIDRLLEILRVGETRFFRHAAHVEALIDGVIPSLRERRGKAAHIRAWSAGCASGEEAYTLAMVLSALLPGPRFHVSVLATDISVHALSLARRGEYPAAALAHVPERWRARGFEAIDSDSGPTRYRIAPNIARLVRFERKNLLQGPYPQHFDIIWCRNVFIYFTREARARVLSRLLASLNPDGVLFVGYSESLRGMADLEHMIEAVHTPHAVIYRKARPALGPSATHSALPPSPDTPRPALFEQTAARERTAQTAARERTAQTAARERIVQTAARERIVRLSGAYHDGARLTAELSTAMSGAVERVIVDLDGAALVHDSTAPVLRRARNAARATGVDFVLRSARPDTRRWLRRHGLDDMVPQDTESRNTEFGNTESINTDLKNTESRNTEFKNTKSQNTGQGGEA